jgi:dCMP deaminase
MNALLWAARNGIQIDGATLYSTYQPCFDCTRAIIAGGIKKIVYKEKYKHHTGNEVEDFIKDN